MQSGASKWNRPVLAIVCAAVVTKNIDIGVFQQTEELLLLAPEERGQTTPVALGWPFALVSTEAYTLNVFWAEDGPLGWRWGSYLLIDGLVAAILSIAGTKYLSHCVDACAWRVNVCALLAGTATFATLVSAEAQVFWYYHGVGAFSAALFHWIDAIVLFCIASAWFWLLSSAGALLGHLSRIVRWTKS